MGLLQTSKGIVIAAIALTGIYATAIFGWQCARFLIGDGTSSLSVLQVLESAGFQSPVRHAAGHRESSLFDSVTITEWFLALPALVPLLFALALLILYHEYLRFVEQASSRRDTKNRP
jgi:hypothetical protein